MTSVRETPIRLTASIVAFCRYARSRGLQVGMQQTLAALEAAQVIGVADEQRFSFALRAALCTSQQEWEKFNQLYDAFWSGPHHLPDSEHAPQTRDRISRKQADGQQVLARLDEEANSSADHEGKLVSGASSQQRLKQVDFSEASNADLAALEQLALRLLRQMSLRLSRRLQIDAQGDHVDLRRSIRRNISHGGEPFRLAFKGRKPRKKRLVIFLDISGSMNLYSLFLLRFAYAMQKHFKRVDTYLFSTGAVEVSDLLRAPTLSAALTAVSHRVREWAGGTKIGASLREFNIRDGRKTLSRNTSFIILSDGWDTGAPEALASALRTTRQRVEKLVWLNPLLGLKDYQPITRGMSAALPHIDVFAPGHNLESLLALERYL